MAIDPDIEFRSPDEWSTRNDPITDAQKSYLQSLTAKAGKPASPEELDDLTKAEASEWIEELREGGDGTRPERRPRSW